MTEPGLVASVDIGTTGVKVAAVDAAASLVRVIQVVHPDPDDARFYRALLPAFARTGEAVEDLHPWSRDGWPDNPAGIRAGRPVEQDAG